MSLVISSSAQQKRRELLALSYQDLLDMAEMLRRALISNSDGSLNDSKLLRELTCVLRSAVKEYIG